MPRRVIAACPRGCAVLSSSRRARPLCQRLVDISTAVLALGQGLPSLARPLGTLPHPPLPPRKTPPATRSAVAAPHHGPSGTCARRPRGTPKSSPKHKPSPSPSKPQAPSESQPPPRELRLAFEDDVLRRIASGVQQYEARLNKGAWRSLSAGDVFVAHSTQREVTLDVYSATRFPSFGDAWTELGTDLVPIRQGVRSKQQADDAYAASQGASASEVKAHGVLALRLQVIFVEMVGDPTVTDSRGASSSDAPVGGGSSSAAGGSAGGSSASAGGAGGLSAGSASSPQCSLPPSAADSEPTSNGGGSGSGKGKAPYRRPGGGKAPASSGKAPRISD